ncbi:hypothetical protein CMU30_02330 [Elizabethkingia anophelis]|nr:hypothetical protein [Elizabethkingia anophelis]MDV3682214.1 hypothetical protein [Elizabethkingia anophelis]MDV3701870.1 hypothetical protein [Elizabethkingia anophelis]MDV3761176.1 hypothetical protein [Elizabethkingia anophelis]MDV3800372.1 hypothetical protein [Elizabethkingia anophelis]
MSLDKLRQTLLEKMKSSIPVQSVWVEVTEVDWEEKTMTAVGLEDDLEYYDILLGLDNISIKPKVGSVCIVGMIDNNGTTPFLLQADEVEDYNIKVSGCELDIQEGFLLRKENETLKKLMVDLISEIRKMKFTTNTGSTIKLINEPELLSIENRFKDFLK